MVTEHPLARRLAAEALGTFALVVVGCGAIVVEAQTGALGHLGVSAAFGLVIMAMVAATGHLSGAHLNPAVTVAFAVNRHFPWRDVAAYAAAQVAGATAGAFVLRLAFDSAADLGATAPSGSAAQALVLETLLTAVLMFVIMAVATDTRSEGQLAAIMIGATVGMNALWAGPVTGASMNPARSLGPALAGGVWEVHWVYWVGPLAGALLGAAAYRAVRSRG